MVRVLDKSRGFVYWLGFNPKPGTILYSISRSLMRSWEESMSISKEAAAIVDAITRNTTAVNRLAKASEDANQIVISIYKASEKEKTDGKD